MKSLIASITILGLVGMVVGVVAQGADTDTVTATVTAELITITVTDGSVDYGVLSINTSKEDNSQVVTNNSNVAVDLEVKSSDAVGGHDWDLAAAAAADAYTHEFAPDGSSWTTFNVDNNTYASLKTNVAVSGVQDLDLKIGTPTSVTDNEEKTITVTVLATKAS